jgi:V/A-type H+-transporting ATPase subunit E
LAYGCMTNLDTLILEIEKRKENERSHLETALAKAKREIEQTKEAKIKELQDHYLNEAKTKSNREAARIVESAKLKAKKILFEAINANMDTTFETIKNEMKTFAQKPEYKETLQRMVSYAKNTLGPDIIIHCREGDRSVLGDMNVQIGSSMNTLGGIVAEDNEGKKELDLTFEELLRTSEDKVKSFLMEKMMVVEQQR